MTDVSCQLGTFGEDAFFVRDPTLLQVIVFHPGTATTGALLQAIDEEIGRLAADGPDRQELARVVNTSSADLWRSLDSLMDRAHIFASVETIHGRAELVEELAPRLATVKVADVAEAASDLLSQHRAVLELQPAGN